MYFRGFFCHFCHFGYFLDGILIKLDELNCPSNCQFHLESSGDIIGKLKKSNFLYKIWHFRVFFAILAIFCQFLATFWMVFLIGGDEFNCSSNYLFHLKWCQVVKFLPNLVIFYGYCHLKYLWALFATSWHLLRSLFDLM